jgi:hypothetical protein
MKSQIREEVNKYLLSTGNEGMTVFHVAADFPELDIFLGILVWAKENPKREEVNKLLLTTGNNGTTVFHMASRFHEKQLFQGILNWPKII